MKLFKAPIALMLATLLLAACGQKGPLYLPESDTPQAPVDGSSQAVPETDDGGEDDTDSTD